MIPPRSIMKISVKPDDDKTDMSLYAYMIGNQDFSLVPNLARCITCEADHKWDRPWKGKVQTSERKVEFQNPTQNTYNILIGVAAPKDVTTGKFKINLNYNSYLVEMEIPAGGSALDHRLAPDAAKLGAFYGLGWKTAEGQAMAAKLPKKGNPFPVPSNAAK